MRLQRLLPLFLILVLSATSAVALHPNHPLGVSSERSYQQGLDQIDHIDLFSGSLGVTIPVGPFRLSYSSNVWRYGSDGAGKIVATPDRENNAGLGWHLGWGEVYSPFHWYNDSGQWMYVGNDGGRRVFYPTLHRGEPVVTDLFYTRDSSYLRMVKVNNQGVDIEFPDGTTRRFACINSGGGCGLGSTFRLRKVWNRYGSLNAPDIEVTYSDFNASGAPELWTLNDRHGRIHTVHFDGSGPFINLRVTKIDLQSFGGQRAIYDLIYQTRNIDVSCKDTSATTSQRIGVPLLTEVRFPDGSSYLMADGSGGSPYYFDTCWNGIGDVSGVLRSVVLPTGGKIAWGWQEYEFPPGGTNSVFNTSAGVDKRVLADRDNNIEGIWDYKTQQFGAGPGGTPQDDPRVTTQVVNPTGDCTKHYFNARYYQTPSQGAGWEYGLPFDYRAQSGGKFRSSETWDNNDGTGNCSGNLLRTTYLKFRRDATPGSGSAPASEWYNTNRAVAESRIVFHDDGNRYTDAVRSEFDGLGHFRRVVTTGNFWSGSTTNERRETFTGFNVSSGIYPGSFVPPAPTAPWILGLFDRVETTENDAIGNQTRKVEFGFESTTGFLTCTRRLKTGFSRAATDILTVNTRNSRGEKIQVKTYGGDLQPLSTAGAACGTPAAQPVAWTTHAYQYGVRKRTDQRTPTGAFAPFPSYDVDLDPSTGLVAAQRDPSGFQISNGYDLLGRPVAITPQAGAVATLTYQRATVSSRAQVITEMRPFPGGGVLTRGEVHFDDFGRLWKERRRLPGNVWTERETLHNGRGWVVSISQWGNLAKRTQFLEFDAFGRAQRIRPPEGASHDVLVGFQGIRRFTRSTKINRASGESYSTVTRETDRYGRVRSLLEPSAATGTTATRNFYNVNNKLTEIRTGSNPQQIRRYGYDNRGFFLSETVPEKGVSGNGSVLRMNFDARGLAHRVVDGPSDLKFSFDALGRMTEIRDANRGDRLVTQLIYDTALGRGEGKIDRAIQHNWVDLPWTVSAQEVLVPVEDSFEYQGLGGAISRKRLKIQMPGQTYNFNHGYEYNALGDLSRLNIGATPIDFTYDHGLLTGVPGWVNSISYHTSGLWSRFDHANGTSDHQLIDSNSRQRPLHLRSSGATGIAGDFWSTGTYSYDGAGNIKTMGPDRFAYDAVSRLVDATVGGHRQIFTYDIFANLLSTTTTPPGGASQTAAFNIDPATNRSQASGTVHDAAGNLSQIPQAAFGWGPSGELKSSNSTQHLYSASKERVATAFGSGRTSPFIRFTERNTGGKLLQEFVLRDGNWRTKRYIHAGGRLAASQDSVHGIKHYHLDHLGNPRRLTNGQGTLVIAQDFLPYGTETTPNNGELLRFTGTERDTPSRSYNHSRHYNLREGRFFSVDSLRGSANSPQSLNRYAYVAGNPINLVDPDGRDSAAGSFQDRINACRADPNCGDSSSWNAQVIGTVADQTRGILPFVDAAGGGAMVGLVCTFGGGSACLGAIMGAGSAIGQGKLSETARYALIYGAGYSLLNPGQKSPTFGKGTKYFVAGTFIGYALKATDAHADESDFTTDIIDPTTGLVIVINEVIDVNSTAGTSANGQDASLPPAAEGATSLTISLGESCSGAACVQAELTGTREEIQRELDRITLELLALGGLNELIQGGCIAHPEACALGGGGGGGGVSPWAIFYAF